MKNILNKIKGFMERDWSLAEKVLVIMCCILYGMVYGFLISPVKKGISCGNNNGNHSGNTYESRDEEWLDDEFPNEEWIDEE